MAEFADDEGNIEARPAGTTYWPAQAMLDWFPKDLAVRFGRRRDTVLDGEYLDLDSSRADEIVAVLENRGYACVKDRHLLNVACGY